MDDVVTLVDSQATYFSETARCARCPVRTSDDHRVAGCECSQCGVVLGGIRGGSLAHDLSERRGESSETRIANGKACLGNAALTTSQESLCALDAARYQVRVRGLCIRSLKASDEVGGGHVRDLGEICDAKGCCVVSLDHVACAPQMAEFVEVDTHGCGCPSGAARRRARRPARVTAAAWSVARAEPRGCGAVTPGDRAARAGSRRQRPRRQPPPESHRRG